MIEIEVVYPTPDAQVVERLSVPVGTTVGQAIEGSGILQRHHELSADSLVVGIYGRRTALTWVLRKFDRIEIYRPLIADPKRARRDRAQRDAATVR